MKIPKIEPNYCALPLTNITSITDDMITTAFDRINLMDGGGDSEEDILLGQFNQTIINYESMCIHHFLVVLTDHFYPLVMSQFSPIE